MLLVPLFFVLIALDPPTMLLSMFGTYALSAPVLWVGRRLRRLSAARRRPAPRLAMDALRRNSICEALGIDVWVPRAAPAAPPRSQCRGGPRRAAPAAVSRASRPRCRRRWEALRARGRCAAPAALCTPAAPRACFGVGNRRRDWLVIGEAPGRRGGPAG